MRYLKLYLDLLKLAGRSIAAAWERVCLLGDEWTFCGPTPEDEARWAALERKESTRQIETMLRMQTKREIAQATYAARCARAAEAKRSRKLTWDGRIKCPE